MEQQTKICKTCGVEKGLGEYYTVKSKGRNEYLMGRCKTCESTAKSNRLKSKYHNDPEYRLKVLEVSKVRQDNNKEKVLEYKKKHNHKSISNLSDRYIKHCLTHNIEEITHDDVTPSMVERYRAKLIAKREAKANKTQQ